MANEKPSPDLDRKVKIMAMYYSDIQPDGSEEESLLLLPSTVGSLFVVGYVRDSQSTSFQPTVRERYATNPRHPDYPAYVAFRNSLATLKNNIEKTRKGEIENAYGFSNKLKFRHELYSKIIKVASEYFNELQKYSVNPITKLKRKKDFSKAQGKLDDTALELVQHIESQIERYRGIVRGYTLRKTNGVGNQEQNNPSP